MAEVHRGPRRTDEFIVVSVDHRISGIGMLSRESGIHSFAVTAGSDDIANNGLLAIERARIEKTGVKFLYNGIQMEIQANAEDVTIKVSAKDEGIAASMKDELFRLYKIVATVEIQQ